MYADKTTQANFVRVKESSEVILAQRGEGKILKNIRKTWNLFVLLGDIPGLQQR